MNLGVRVRISCADARVACGAVHGDRGEYAAGARRRLRARAGSMRAAGGGGVQQPAGGCAAPSRAG